MPTLRQRLGCWLHERPSAEIVLRCPRLAARLGLTWQDLRNRHERIRRDERSGGRECLWQFSSQWTGAKVFPALGMRLLRHCIPDAVPLNFDSDRTLAGHPQVSVLVPVGGTGRMPLFQIVLAALRAQDGVPFEIIVVEQSCESTLAAQLPADVIYLHARSSGPEAGFNKSWALNVAARAARGETLVIHDADYVPPPGYLRQCHDVLRRVEGARSGRLIFYLDAATTGHIVTTRHFDPRMLHVRGVEAVVQNNPTPLAVRRQTYWEIGGHDESYFGWGEEDAEFLERLRTRAISEAGWAPLVHLWHPPAPQKATGTRNHALHAVIAARPPTQRIETLRALVLGGEIPQVAESRRINSACGSLS